MAIARLPHENVTLGQPKSHESRFRDNPTASERQQQITAEVQAEQYGSRQEPAGFQRRPFQFRPACTRHDFPFELAVLASLEGAGCRRIPAASITLSMYSLRRNG